jgi:integrase
VPRARGLLTRSTTGAKSRTRSTKREVGEKGDFTPSRRRKRGSGGVVFVRDGVWRVDLEVSRDPVTGRRRRVARVVHGSREDAEVALARLRVADHEKRLPRGTTARSVAAALQLYQQAVASGAIELAPSTANTVRWVSKLLTNLELADGRRFGDVRLSRLTWEDIEAAYGAIRARGGSVAYVRRCATILSRALDFARKRGLIDSNPAKDATRPRTARSKPHAPTVEEVRLALDAASGADPEVADAAAIVAGTGMRKGEVLALQWGDVDFERSELHVAASVTDAGPGIGLVRKSTKTSDWRDVPMTGSVALAFERQLERRRSFGEPGREHYVFAGGLEGTAPMRPDVLSNRWAAARGAHAVTLQHLRHFAATRMLDAGESYRTVADILGNSESTLRLHYDGRTDVGKRRAITALEL